MKEVLTSRWLKQTVNFEEIPSSVRNFNLHFAILNAICNNSVHHRHCNMCERVFLSISTQQEVDGCCRYGRTSNFQPLLTNPGSSIISNLKCYFRPGSDSLSYGVLAFVALFWSGVNSVAARPICPSR